MTDNSWAKGYAAGKESNQGELTWQRAEIERLRAALERIANDRGLNGIIDRIQNIARNTLNDGTIAAPVDNQQSTATEGKS